MKLGSLKSNSLDGTPVLISKNNKLALNINHIVPCLRVLLENWNHYESQLQPLYKELNNGSLKNTLDVSKLEFHAPLPRTFHWVDGSAFIHHIKLVRKARNAPLPDDIYEVPLVYQGGSDTFLAPKDPIPLVDESHGLDFESEVGVITDYVPMGTKKEEALKHIKLLVILNDVSLRGLIPAELARGFGFYQSKPSTAFAPFAVTPDELGSNWKEGKFHLPLNTYLNGKLFGHPNAQEMFFSFAQIIEHICLTRALGAGTIIGSGTVSNEDPTVGSSCLAEKRMIEIIETGKASTPFMKAGDKVKIEMLLPNGDNIFGTIEQTVENFKKN